MTPSLVDLRSDTVTRPTPAMREAMLHAEVGDDVFGEDPVVNTLQERMATLFGHEAGLFCPSGTMTNQIAIHVHTRPGDEVICDEGAHIYRYEGGGVMATSGCSVKFVTADRGRFTAQQVSDAVNDRDAAYLANSRLVNIENTTNRGGGSCWDIEEVKRIRAVSTAKNLAMHMDGARIFNAMAADGTRPVQWGALFDSISICLSKGLGAPVGSVLVGSKAFIHQAHRVRKRLGGGMRQVGVIAAAGLHALDHHVERLRDDHRRAQAVGDALVRSSRIAEVLPVETNIVIYTLAAGADAKTHVEQLRERGVLAMAISPSQVRMVFHLDVDDDGAQRTIEALNHTLA
jgi:threonine aldolase